jgi:biopolymer transport protein ExbD
MSIQLRTHNLGSGTFTKHLVARAYKKSGGKKVLFASLMLTSMVDMFSLLVIFLLQTFSASPELMVIGKGVTLPSAATGKELKDAPVLAISNEEVYLDQKLVGNTAELLKNPTALMEKLRDLRELWMKTHPSQTFPGEISLQASRELSSTIVSQFMAMLPSQAYSSVQLAVISGGAG